MKLGVNIDHIASIREIRKGNEPQPVFAALICQTAGADSIVVHLREDRRHIKEQDLYLLKRVVKIRLNLEMSVAPEIVNIACSVKPDQATLVPERRKEITTEGGLDVANNQQRVAWVTRKLTKNNIAVSLFIDPDKFQLDAAGQIGAQIIELHTGRYAEAKTAKFRQRYLTQLETAAQYAKTLGMTVNAGHGLDYYNVVPVANINQIEELNIGYSIICRAAIVGLERAVKEMKALIK